MSIKIPKTKPAQLEFLISCAVQAPSSHNTQPWQFSLADNVVAVFADMSRCLKIGDPMDRELYVSIGASIQNILSGADALGMDASYTLFPKNRVKPDLVAEITLNFPSKKRAVKNDLIDAIWNRRTNRSPYLPDKKIPATLQKSLVGMSEDFGLKLTLVNDHQQISHLGSLVETGMLKFLKKDSFRQELSTWIRHDWSKKGDGLPGYSLGMAGIISIMAPIFIRSASKIHEVAASENTVVKSSPSIGIITIPRDNKSAWVKTGMLFESMALKLHNLGVATAILTAAVESKPERLQLKKIVKGEPGLFFRLGYPTEAGIRVPRRDASHVTR